MLIDKETAIGELKRKKVVAIATDTVFGLCALAGEAEPIEEIYRLKERPAEKALIVLCANLFQVEELAEVSPSFAEVAGRYWPGPITFVLPKRGGGTIAVRIPDHRLLLEVIEKSGPLVAPSANRSGEAPCLERKEVEAVFGEDFPCLGERGSGERASTLVDWNGGEWKILRQGPVNFVG